MTLDEISKGIIEALDNTLASDKAVEALSSKIIDGKGTYADAERLASKTGAHTGKAISAGLIQNSVDGRVTEDVVRAAIIEPLKHNHSIVSGACRFVQEALNRKAGLGLKAIQPKFNQDRADGLVTEAVGREDMSDFAKALTQQVENFSMATVDDSVKENADAHYEAGLYPKIRRITDGKCCEWCSSLAGTYEYGEVRNTGNDVFRRHPNCGCQVLYDPSDGSRWQDVHSKKDLSAEESNVDRVMARIRASRAEKQRLQLAASDQRRDKWELIHTQDIHEVRKMYNLLEERKMPKQRIAEAEQILASGNSSDISHYAHNTAIQEHTENLTELAKEKASERDASVVDSSEYVEKSTGNVYKVDGVNVKLIYTDEELETGKLLSRILGKRVKMCPVVVGKYRHISTPDYLVGDNEERWDRKGLEGKGKDAVRDNIKKKKEQADNFVIDISKWEGTVEDVISQAYRVFLSSNTRFVNTLIITRGEEILLMLKRTG